MLVILRETYVLTIETASQSTETIMLTVRAITNTERPFADESEARVRESVKQSAQYNPIHADAVQIDGAWFELTAHGPGSGKPWSTANYFGNRNGISYMLNATFKPERTSVDDMRAVIEHVAFAVAPVRDDVTTYRDFLTRAVTPQGLSSQFGTLPIARSKRFNLDSMIRIRVPDGTGPLGAAGYHRVEYERSGGWLSMLCLPDGKVGRDELEKKMLSGDAIWAVEAQPSLDTPAGEIRRKTFQRRALGGGSVPARVWTAYRDGTLFEITTDASPTKADVQAIEAILSDSSRRCDPLRVAASVSTPAPASP